MCGAVDKKNARLGAGRWVWGRGDVWGLFEEVLFGDGFVVVHATDGVGDEVCH